MYKRLETAANVALARPIVVCRLGFRRNKRARHPNCGGGVHQKRRPSSRSGRGDQRRELDPVPTLALGAVEMAIRLPEQLLERRPTREARHPDTHGDEMRVKRLWPDFRLGYGAANALG